MITFKKRLNYVDSKKKISGFRLGTSFLDKTSKALA